MVKIKEGFKNERILYISDSLLNDYKRDTLLGNLYIRKMGYFPQAKFHFIHKEDDCDYALLIYCVEGKGWYEVGQKQYALKKNEFIILPPHTPYTFGASAHHPWSIYWLHFQGKEAHRFIPRDLAPGLILPDEDSRIQDRLRLFEEIYHNFAMNYRKDYMLYACLCLYQFLASFTLLKPYRDIHRKSNTFTARVIRYMQENIQDNLTLPQLAAYFKLSPSHFSAKFQQETGISPIRYFTRLKMQKACQMMEYSTLMINEISQNLGFSDPAYFSRTFFKVVGVSPSDYRKRENIHCNTAPAP